MLESQGFLGSFKPHMRSFSGSTEVLCSRRACSLSKHDLSWSYHWSAGTGIPGSGLEISGGLETEIWAFISFGIGTGSGTEFLDWSIKGPEPESKNFEP